MKQPGQPPRGRTPSADELRTLIEARDLEALMAAMNESGRVPTLRLAHKLATQALSDDPETHYQWGVAMAQRQDWGTRSAAGWFLGAHYRDHPDDVCRWLVDLGDDNNWSIREGAAFGFARVLNDNFEEVLPRFHQWRSVEMVNIRRAVVIAVMPVIRDAKHGAERAPVCLDLLEPLLADREPYIRKNLGPFAIGTAFLNHHSELTFGALDDWRDRYDDSCVRWNLAKAVSSSGGRRHHDRSMAFLQTLADDRRPEVVRAVSSAMRSLAKAKSGVQAQQINQSDGSSPTQMTST